MLLDYTLRPDANLLVYFSLFLWAFLVILYASWWDRLQRRVPNVLWLLTAFTIPAGFLLRDWALDLFLLPIVLGFGVLMRVHRLWGMGDAKGILWLALAIGTLPAAVATILATAHAVMARWQAQKAGRPPSHPYMVSLTWGVAGAFALMLFGTMK